MAHRYFQNQFAGADDTSAGDATELKEELNEDLVHCVVSFQSISSGAQLGRSGICVAFGVVLFYFGSIVGPLIVPWMTYGLFMYSVKWRL